MGSFANRCAISNLPIDAGNDVRAFLLTECPYDDMKCNSTSFWFPRTFPIRAKYDSYGKIDRYQEGPAKDLWMEGLQLDLIERGMGDNTCHDVPVNRGMSFEDLLEALWERRVLVQRDTSGNLPALKIPKQKIPSGVATMSRVRKLLVAAGETIQNKGFSGPGWFVSNRTSGQIRVRWADYNDKMANLERGKQIIEKHYPCVIGYSDRNQYPELYVFTRPDVEKFYPARADKKKPLRVEMAMVREDVWQSLISESDTADRFDGPVTSLEDFKQAIRIAYESSRPKKFSNVAEIEAYLNKLHLKTASSQEIEKKNPELYNRMGGFSIQNAVPFTCAWEEHWKLLVEKNLPKDVVEPILDSIAEMMRVAQFISTIRIHWQPSYSIGPQFGQWTAHSVFHQRMADISFKILAEQKSEYDEDSEELEV